MGSYQHIDHLFLIARSCTTEQSLHFYGITITYPFLIIYTISMTSEIPSIKCNISLDEALKRPWATRAILHLDLDAFFASVAQLDNPLLRGEPVIVGGDPQKRGVVSTCSYEARAFGIHSAMASARALQLCPQAHWVRPDFDRYHELSSRVMTILHEYTPLVEQASIDEAYAEITTGRVESSHPVSIAQEIAKRITELGITGSIGLSTSKTVSKIGSDFLKPSGITVIEPGQEASFLAPLPLERLGGIGAVTAARLKSAHYVTLGDLAQANPQDLRPLIGSAAPELIARASGIDPSPLVTQAALKSISHETTFEYDTNDISLLNDTLTVLSEKVAWRAREHNLKGRTITLKLRLSDLSRHTASRTLESATDDTSLIAQVGQELLSANLYAREPLRLIGIALSNWSEISTLDEAYCDLFTTDEERAARSRRTRLNKGVDQIRRKFGYESIGSATRLKNKQAPEENVDSRKRD